MKVEKALNFWVEGMNRKRVPVDGNVLRPKALSLYEDFQKKDGMEEETKSFTASRVCLLRFRNRFNLKNIKIIGEAAPAHENVAAMFLTEFKKKKIIKEGKYDPRIRLKRPNPLLSYIREKVHRKCTTQCTVHVIITLFNVGNVLLCVIYQLNFTVFMYGCNHLE